MHVVVAVIVKNTLEHTFHSQGECEKDRENEKNHAFKKILEVFQEADVDEDGEVLRLEIQKSLEKPEVIRHLHEVNVDVRQAENLFNVLAYDESGSLDTCSCCGWGFSKASSCPARPR